MNRTWDSEISGANVKNLVDLANGILRTPGQKIYRDVLHLVNVYYNLWNSARYQQGHRSFKM